MLDETYVQLAGREANYWWHVARRELIAALLTRQGFGDGSRALDLGCGTGANLLLARDLGARCIVGLDRSGIALAYSQAKAPGCVLVQADLNAPLPFQDRSFDLCTCFNVLYHSWVIDPQAVLRDAARVLAPGGLMLVTEPAFPALGRAMDQIALGRRRFRPRAFRALCEGAGFEVVLATCFTSFGVPAIMVIKALERLHRHGRDEAPPQDMKPMRPWTNRLALTVARAENKLILAGLKLPVGVTLCFLCRKRENAS